MGDRKEIWISIWGRRLVSIPLYFFLAAVCYLGLPLWGSVTVLLDITNGRTRRFPKTRALAFGALYLGCEVLGVLGVVLIWCFTAGGRVGGAARFVDLNRELQGRWTSALFRGSVAIFSMRLSVEGAELAKEGPFLLFVRHASTADTVLAATLIANPYKRLLRYVLKRELLWDPCLDIVGRRLPNAFVDRKTGGPEEIAAVASLANNLGTAEGVLIYPEGTRFSASKRDRAVRKLRENKQDTLARIAEGFRHVLPPKLGGPLALFENAPGIDLLLAEHTGFEGAASIGSFWGGELIGRTIHVRVRRFRSEEIPASGRDLWLYERWAEMDAWIDLHLEPSTA
ncbi:MAG: 1-acyl-sn-glycerol-3-phosphate acyltransferase [Polyangiaceae bacterium]|nr:1-acyl-sn-glycerol-3-phosphate acyltransferase [Polyangiaceae bacterium]